MNPFKVDLTFNTVPSGLSVTIDGIPRTTPYVHDTLVGFTHAVVAPNQSSGGTAYTFASWSDGGTQAHALVVPAAQTYAATFQGAVVDTQPPTAPANVTATPAGTGQINLGWTASTDNVGVTGYRVERCRGQRARPLRRSRSQRRRLLGHGAHRVDDLSVPRPSHGCGDEPLRILEHRKRADRGRRARARRCLSFNEGAGTAINDASGLGNHGAQTGALWQAGRYGQACGSTRTATGSASRTQRRST